MADQTHRDITQAEAGCVEATRGRDEDAFEDTNVDKHLHGHTNYHGIDTTQVQPGADAVYEAKITILNEALIDIGMGPFQWKMFATTGFGWFIDQVSYLVPTPFRDCHMILTSFLALDASCEQHSASGTTGVQC